MWWAENSPGFHPSLHYKPSHRVSAQLLMVICSKERLAVLRTTCPFFRTNREYTTSNLKCKDEKRGKERILTMAVESIHACKGLLAICACIWPNVEVQSLVPLAVVLAREGL
jgi:hypothetical protein